MLLTVCELCFSPPWQLTEGLVRLLAAMHLPFLSGAEVQ